MKNLTQKIILAFLSFWLLVVSCMSFVTPAAYAQDSTWYNQPFTEWYTKVYGEESPPNEIFGERYTAAQVQWIIWSLISQPLNWLGKDNQEFIACAIQWIGNENIDLSTCWSGYTTAFLKVLQLLSPITIGANNYQGSDVAFVTSNFVGTRYISKQLSKFNIVPEVNAQIQGFGYGAVGILQPLWSVSRNIAYTFLVFFIIIFAFMIMFRVKINPQTVISVQSAIPKVVIAAVLATFSFAIAGLVIDLMYVVIGVVAGFISPFDWSISFKVIYNILTGGGFLGINAASPLTIITYMFTYTLLFLILLIVNLVSVVATWSIFSGLLSILMLLLVVWLLILCIWYMIKIPWMLIKTVINIFISVIVAPIQIVAGAVMPNIGFGTWIKNLIANVMVFPFVGIMFYLAYFFLAIAYFTVGETVIEKNIGLEVVRTLGFDLGRWGQGIVPGDLWSPPFLGSGAEITPLIFALMSFGIIIAIPKAAEILKALILGEKFAYGTAIGEAMAPISGPLKFAGGAFQEGVGRYAGAPLLEGAMESKWYKSLAQKGKAGEQFNIFVQRLYEQLNRSAK